MDHNLFDPYLPQPDLVIKDEHCGSPLLSPPTSPSLSSSLTLPSLADDLASPQQSCILCGLTKTPATIPLPQNLSTGPQEEYSTMSSNGAAYGSYTHGSARSHGRSHPSGERRVIRRREPECLRTEFSIYACESCA